MINFESYLVDNLHIPEEIIPELTKNLRRKSVSKGEILLSGGEICENTFFVDKGLLRMFSLDKMGKEHIIQFAPENWLISDRSSQFFNQKSQFTIDAVEASKVIIVPNDFFTNFTEKLPETAQYNDRLLNKHIRSLQNRVNSLLAETAEQRYLNFIRMYPNVLSRVPQWMVASYLGITPESLSRVRKEIYRKEKLGKAQ